MRQGFLVVGGVLDGVLAKVDPVGGWLGRGEVGYRSKFIVVHDMELRAYHSGLEIQNKGDGAGVARGVTQVDPGV